MRGAGERFAALGTSKQAGLNTLGFEGYCLGSVTDGGDEIPISRALFEMADKRAGGIAVAEAKQARHKMLFLRGPSCAAIGTGLENTLFS